MVLLDLLLNPVNEKDKVLALTNFRLYEFFYNDSKELCIKDVYAGIVICDLKGINSIISEGFIKVRED